ncbi:MAG: retroviral-like aspartic protease family protein [Nitrospirae bacterium]|nr:retroviral-like aspartic protease family protein [Nitrospirota bacterium]
MPIRNFPFYKIKKDRCARPWLPIKLINPETRLDLITIGLIDTGADECSVPATFAKKLGHNLQAVTPKFITTASGLGRAYPHATTIEIYDVNVKNILHSIPNVIIDYTEGLNIVLLGMKNFLENFILEINYPKEIFHIKKIIN